jgi:hypothetical protein
MYDFIDRHYEGLEVHRDKVLQSKKKRARLVSLLELNPAAVGSVLVGAKIDAEVHLSIDPGATELGTWEAWTAYMEVAEAIFAITQTPKGRTTERVIDKKPRSLSGTGVEEFAHAGNWLTAFFLARTCRDEQRLEFLCNVSIEDLREAQVKSGVEFEEYVYYWISTLQDFTLDRSSVKSNLAKSFELSTPTGPSDPKREVLDLLILPQLNTFLRAAEGNTEKFNEGIEQGLRSFRSYYTATEERSKDIDGVVPMGLLSASCLAFDLSVENPEFQPEFNSDYLPERILNRFWERYFASQ